VNVIPASNLGVTHGGYPRSLHCIEERLVDGGYQREHVARYLGKHSGQKTQNIINEHRVIQWRASDKEVRPINAYPGVGEPRQTVQPLRAGELRPPGQIFIDANVVVYIVQRQTDHLSAHENAA